MCIHIICARENDVSMSFSYYVKHALLLTHNMQSFSLKTLQNGNHGNSIKMIYDRISISKLLLQLQHTPLWCALLHVVNQSENGKLRSSNKNHKQSNHQAPNSVTEIKGKTNQKKCLNPNENSRLNQNNISTKRNRNTSNYPRTHTTRSNQRIIKKHN